MWKLALFGCHDVHRASAQLKRTQIKLENLYKTVLFCMIHCLDKTAYRLQLIFSSAVNAAPFKKYDLAIFSPFTKVIIGSVPEIARSDWKQLCRDKLPFGQERITKIPSIMFSGIARIVTEIHGVILGHLEEIALNSRWEQPALIRHLNYLVHPNPIFLPHEKHPVC